MNGPRLETARLRLRPWEESDVAALHALFVEPDVRRFLWDGRVIAPDETRALVARSRAGFATEGLGHFALLLREDASLVGCCGLVRFGEEREAEILYALHPDWWGRGLATEAARAVLTYGFESLGLERILARADAPNAPSIRVMARLGMRFEGREPGPAHELLRYALARNG